MQKTEFSKNNTLALKGIAIIMMVFHHCFRATELFEGYNVSFFPFSKNFVVELSSTFKICVSIFAFLTGYGLILSLKKLSEKYEWNHKQIFKWISERLIKTLSGYWIIVILSLIICQLIDGKTAEVLFKNGIIYGSVKVILNLFGLSKLTSTTMFCSTWWYMSIAILFIVSIPIFAKLFKKYRYLPVLFFVFIIPRIIGWKYVNSSYISFLFPFLLGIIFGENNLMVKIANIKVYKKNEYINKILKFIIGTIIVVLLYKIYNRLPYKKFWEIRYGIIPVCMMCYLYEFYIDLPIIKQILVFLGKNSMNMFLIHSFLIEDYLKDFLYGQENFIKIAMALLVISLVISIIIELFQKATQYNKLIDKLQLALDRRIDKIYEKEQPKKLLNK